MENVPGFNDVRYDPSRLRPRTVVADVDVKLFLGESLPRTEAKVEVLWRPREGTDVQRVHWADDVVNLGWHKDDDHPELRTTHFQLEAEDESVHKPGAIEVEAPLSFLEVCLDRLPDELRQTSDY
ncbi:hypothetical protein [Halorussus salinisoli]|uniref:hypothetical protein n=1 Tax=Halorussus salinisoli TaxID=2558242 RepID=UPI002A90F8AB|nr:hypothetical protein [Halorussus salinisoli]